MQSSCALDWVEPAFRENFREKSAILREAKHGEKLYFSRCEMRRKMALCCWRKMAKMALSKRNLSEKNWRKTALLKRRTGFPQALDVPHYTFQALRARDKRAVVLPHAFGLLAIVAGLTWCRLRAEAPAYATLARLSARFT
jgi:hypothetical protein